VTTLHFGRNMPGYLLLPVIPGTEQRAATKGTQGDLKLAASN
jgi:hypothetical protein